VLAEVEQKISALSKIIGKQLGCFCEVRLPLFSFRPFDAGCPEQCVGSLGNLLAVY